MKNIFLISAIFLLVFSCEMKKEMSVPKTQIQKENLAPKKPAESSPVFKIVIKEIDSAKFAKAEKDSVRQAKISKVSDFEQAKKMLKGVVQFADGDEDGETQALVKINFKNGKTLRFKEGFHEEYFVAYFPDEDILLCERGHSSDLSFNLKNGEETKLTGNPNHIKTSADGKLRVNSYYDGQEYYGYFYRKKLEIDL